MTITLRDGLVLHAPGGVHIPSANALVIADVHAGYTATLRSRGYGVPVADDMGLLGRVSTMLQATSARHVVVAGDLVHGAAATRGADDSPLGRFLAALSQFQLTIVLGNHDRSIGSWLEARGVTAVRDVALGPHRVHHGDDVERACALRDEAIAEGGRVLVGHLHPAVAVDGDAGVRALLPAFVTARGLLCLPALSPYARGVELRSERMRNDLRALSGDTDLGAACVVGTKTIALGVILRASEP